MGVLILMFQRVLFGSFTTFFYKKDLSKKLVGFQCEFDLELTRKDN